MGLMAFMEAMGTSSVPVLAAFFIGLMTAISPCPLTTNITAIAYISKRIDDTRHILAVGFLYTLGRMLTYTALAFSIVWLGLNTQATSFFLQRYGEKVLGPLLIVIGVVLLDVVRIRFLKASSRLDSLKKNLAEKGFIGAFLLGVIFALAFCPFSAVLFFGMLIPLALKTGDAIFLPSVFAFATGLPVIVFSFILVYSVSQLGRVMDRIQMFEKWVRKIVALIFVGTGLYYSLTAYL